MDDLALADDIEAGARRAHEAGLPTVIMLPPYKALWLATVIRSWADRRAVAAQMQRDAADAAEISEEAMRDLTARASLAIDDLELLLERFIGRPVQTVEQVRAWRSKKEIEAVGTRRHPQPSRGIPISAELRRTVMTGRIGDPREPGSDDE